MEQRTEEWHTARLGKATASRIAGIIAKLKDGKPAASRENIAVELALEILTGNRQESFSNAAMQWGTDTEPQARAAYESYTGKFAEEVGFIDHPTIPMAGCSPDGLVEDGLIEIKCPNSATHLKTITAGKADSQYIPQIQWQMACTGRAWCDFVSFDPRFPEKHRMAIFRVQRDQEYINTLEAEVLAFNKEVQAIVERLKS